MFRTRKETYETVEGKLDKNIIEINTRLDHNKEDSWVQYASYYNLNNKRINKEHAEKLLHNQDFNKSLLEEIIK